MKTKLSNLTIFALAAMLLAACAAPVATVASTTIPTEALVATQAPTAAAATETAPAAIEATDSTATAESTSGADVRTYVIVPERSKVSYSVGEVFFNDNNRFNLAIGVTQEVNGEVFLNFAAPEQSSIGPVTVDISTFVSDSNRRDNAIRTRWLESQSYPLSTFTPKTVTGIPAQYTDGTEIELHVEGDLTVREVTQPVTFLVKAKLVGDELTGSASTEILMSNFGFDAPDIAGMLKAEDKVLIDFEFVAVPKQ